MVIGSVGWLIWIFVAVTTATVYREPISIIGYDPEVIVNGPRTENSEWSLVEWVQKFAELPGSGARLVVDRAGVAASRPAVAAMLERHLLGAPRDVEDPILHELMRLLPNTQVDNMVDPSPSAARTDAEPSVEAACQQQVAEQLSAETAVPTAVWAMKHSCDSQRQAAVGFIKDHLGQVLATQGWAQAVRTQPEEVVQLSRLLAEQLATTRMLPVEEKAKLLIEAAQEGQVEELRALLAAGAFPGTRDIYRRTVLQWAAWRGHAEVASCLLDAGSGVGTTDDEWYQPLHMAAIGGNPDVVRLLAAWGADPNARDKWGWTPLHLTVREHRPEAALALMEVGADGGVRNNRGLTPLGMARSDQYHDQEMADILA